MDADEGTGLAVTSLRDKHVLAAHMHALLHSQGLFSMMPASWRLLLSGIRPHQAKMLRHMPKYKKGVLTPGICTLCLSSVLLSMLSSRRRFHPCTALRSMKMKLRPCHLS